MPDDDANEIPTNEKATSGKNLEVIVPSLRVDVLGARAFKVSRAYFAKGVAAGRVSVGATAAGKSTTVEPGQEVVARGLGSFTLISVNGETRRENLKVTLTVRPAPAD